METAEANVISQWFDLCHRLGVSLGAAMDMGEELRAAHGEAARRYHTLEHVGEVLRIAEDVPLSDADRLVVETALWFHDAVYDPTAPSGANERASAEMAAAWLDDVGAPVDGALVASIIDMTAGHEVAPDAALSMQVVHDVDLAILGATPDRYERYAVDIRTEYGHLDDETFRAGRAAVLRAMLDRPRLFVLPALRMQYEAPARANIEAELARLTS